MPYIALKPVRLNDRVIQPGDIVPGAEDWPAPARRACLNSRKILLVDAIPKGSAPKPGPVVEKTASSDAAVVKCPQCEREFTSVKSLSAHKGRAHKAQG